MKPKLIILEGSNQIIIDNFKKYIIEKEKIDNIHFTYKNKTDNMFFNLYDLSLFYMNKFRELSTLQDIYIEQGFISNWINCLLESPVCNNKLSFQQFLTNISELMKPSYKSAFNYSLANYNFINEYLKKNFDVFHYFCVYPLNFENLIQNKKDFYQNKTNFLYHLVLDLYKANKIDDWNDHLINILKEELGIKYE